MKNLKYIFSYSLWTIVSIVLGIVYMRILIGPYSVSEEGIGFLVHMFYNWGIFYVGLAVGVVIALLFILLDVFYLKNKLINKKNSVLIRFSVLLVITVFVTILHYLLEKVIDVI